MTNRVCKRTQYTYPWKINFNIIFMLLKFDDKLLYWITFNELLLKMLI